MCYKKPAPRCSKHAREALRDSKVRLSKAEKALIDAQLEFEHSEDALSQSMLAQIKNEIEAAKEAHATAKVEYDKASEEKREAYAAFKVANMDYALTPEGIQKVRDSGNQKKADKLAAHRQKLIDASKGKQPAHIPTASIDPRVSEILAQHVEFENGRVTAETRNAKTQRRLAIKGFLQTATPKEALPLVSMTNDPDEVKMVVEHFNIDRFRTAAELSADPSLKSWETNRNHAITMSAIDNPAIQTPEKLKSVVLDRLTSLRDPEPLLVNPAVSAAIGKRLDALPDSGREYLRGDSPREQMTAILKENATTAKFKPKADVLAERGGNYWSRDDKQRVYFETADLVKELGGSYKKVSGQWGKVEFDGKPYDVRNADLGKSYYDLNEGGWAFTSADSGFEGLLTEKVKQIELPE